MFQNSQRGTLVWLFIIGMALGLTLVAGKVPAAIAAGMLAAYLALLWFVVRGVKVGSVMEALPKARRSQPSEVALEAVARARGKPNYDALIRLIDVGLVVDEPRPDGLSLRRGRFISLDDDGVRPFAVVDVPETLSERLALVRFEIRDESGKPNFVYETEKWLKPGENAILPDYRMPIRANASNLDAGAWTAQVMIDGGLLEIHHFSLSPSLTDRRRLLSSDGEIRERVWRTPEEDASLPLSLEELLRQQSRQRRQS